MRRKLERRWRTTRNDEDKKAYKVQCRKVNKLLDEVKMKYYSSKVLEAGNNQKEVFNVINMLLHRNKGSPLPSTESVEQLCEEFADFFSDKILKIRENLEEVADLSQSVSSNKFNTNKRLDNFKAVSEDEVQKLIAETPSKSCELDALPTWLLKECLTSLLPLITRIVNVSLTEASVPAVLKKALLKPLIKKALLDSEQKKNYRPVSNLEFVSKLIEKVVAKQMVEYLIENDLLEKIQSAYRKFHSTETALVKVANDLLVEMDAGKICLLVLLDLSAAFDTIDHTLLLLRLKHDLGITGKAYKWIASYVAI